VVVVVVVGAAVVVVVVGVAVVVVVVVVGAAVVVVVVVVEAAVVVVVVVVVLMSGTSKISTSEPSFTWSALTAHTFAIYVPTTLWNVILFMEEGTTCSNPIDDPPSSVDSSIL
jgi:hypothetical protein